MLAALIRQHSTTTAPTSYLHKLFRVDFDSFDNHDSNIVPPQSIQPRLQHHTSTSYPATTPTSYLHKLSRHDFDNIRQPRLQHHASTSYVAVWIATTPTSYLPKLSSHAFRRWVFDTRLVFTKIERPAEAWQHGSMLGWRAKAPEDLRYSHTA
jgi:hypothetical protein